MAAAPHLALRATFSRQDGEKYYTPLAWVAVDLPR